MKRESKVAWRKEASWNRTLLQQLTSGSHVSHSDLLKAVDDKDHVKFFDLTQAQPLKKENYVIFQYGVFLQRSDGRVAVFERAMREQGQERVTSGRSVLLSQSSPDAPAQAVPRVIHHQVLVGNRARMQNLSSCGILWNPLPPKKDGRQQPTYLFSLYRHVLPDDNPLHGRFKDSPDSFIDWVPAQKLPELMKKSGYVDQMLAAQLASGAFTAVNEGDNGVIFSPSSRLVADDGLIDHYELMEYSSGYNVFISHASEDSFSAFALYRFMIDESSRTILASLDLTDVRDGEHLSKLERLIRDCDGVVLVITPSLLAKADRHQVAGTKDWVRWEIETARSFAKPIIGFKLGTLDRPSYLPDDLVVNDKAAYGDWLAEVRNLVTRVQEKFGKP